MRAALVAALLSLLAPAAAAAAPELVKVGDFSSPVGIAAPPGDASRLFVVERGGLVRLVKDGATLPAPFADLTGPVLAGGERGLLGMAFAPDYAASGLAYVFLTAESPVGELQIRELRRSADPDRAEPGAGRLVLGVPHADAANHNGGQLAFGRDGYLYAATGDGGGSNDPGDDAANTSSLLGKILRINPREGGAPPDNPFGNQVWSYGLRNPWRFSFDRATGDLVIGDVGQGVKEEIDWAPASAGGGRGVNFGWHCWEGSIPTPSDPSNRNSAPLCATLPASQPPALERDHNDGFCAIVGGFVVRDPRLSSLAGRYLYGDNCQSGLESVALGAPGGPVATGLSVAALTSFGEDACGRIYVASIDGPVSRLQDGAPSACSFPSQPGPGGGQAVTGDTRPCALRVTYRRTQRVLRRGGRKLRLGLRADEACTARLKARRFRSKTVALASGRKRVTRLKPTRKGLRRMRRTLARSGKVRLKVTVRVIARDAAGNLTRRTARPRLRR
jgi:Glucose / Sorbosone dehydrogenase